MRTLTIIRHGHAEKQSAEIDDFERDLDKRGIRQVTEMAVVTKEHGLKVDYILTSTATRTLRTANAFAKTLEFPLSRIRHDERLYLATYRLLSKVIQLIPDRYEDVIVVGHNPGLTSLVAWLMDDDGMAELPTSAVCTLAIDLPHWAAIGRGVATLKRLQTP